MRRFVLVVAFATVVAGCAAPLVDGEAESRSTEQLTPVPVPGDAADADEPTLLLNGSTRVEPAAHGQRGVNESWRATAGNETLLRYEGTTVRTSNFVYTRHAASGPATGELLRNHRNATSLWQERYMSHLGGGAERTVDGASQNTSMYHASETLLPPVDAEDRTVIAALFELSTDAVDSTEDGYRVRASAETVPTVLVAPWLTDAHDATLEAVVTEGGLVSWAELQYDARYRGRDVRVTYRVAYSSTRAPSGTAG
jgi:hypothetical protein